MPTTVPPRRKKTKAQVRQRRQVLLILRLKAAGFSPAEIARTKGVIYSEQWVRTLLKRKAAQHAAKSRTRGGARP